MPDALEQYERGVKFINVIEEYLKRRVDELEAGESK